MTSEMIYRRRGP